MDETLKSKHFPQIEAVPTVIDYLVLFSHIEHNPIGEEVVWLKGYRPESSRYRRRRKT